MNVLWSCPTISCHYLNTMSIFSYHDTGNNKAIPEHISIQHKYTQSLEILMTLTSGALLITSLTRILVCCELHNIKKRANTDIRMHAYYRNNHFTFAKLEIHPRLISPYCYYRWG